jgi:hypothetical protein
MGDLSDFDRRQILGERLAGASVKATTSLDASRATVSKVMSAYTNHGKIISMKRNSGQKSTLIDGKMYIAKDCFQKSHNYCGTGGSSGATLGGMASN